MKYRYISWKQLVKDYENTLFLCFMAAILAIITYISKCFKGYINVWNAFLCGLYVSMTWNTYIMERFFNKEKWRREIKEMADKEAQRVITLLEAERAKMDGEEWKK